jgi:hypothetical protein
MGIRHTENSDRNGEPIERRPLRDSKRTQVKVAEIVALMQRMEYYRHALDADATLFRDWLENSADFAPSRSCSNKAAIRCRTRCANCNPIPAA